MISLRYKRKVRREPRKDTFIISYFIGDPFDVGIVQAFKMVEGQLFVLTFEERRSKRNRTRWIPALCCTCKEILNVKSLQEIIVRDKVTIKDLKIIEDFQKKYSEGKMNSRVRE